MLSLLHFFIACSSASAAPIPATSSSLLMSQKPQIFRSVKGFTVNAGKTEWVLGDTPSTIPSVVSIYRSPEMHKGIQPVMTVRIDELNRKMELMAYVKQWMKDYSTLGFKVLQAKPMKVNSQIAYIVDIDEARGEKRMRQVVFLKDQTAVVMTCRDHRETFDTTIKDCNEIFKTFEWNSSPASADRTGA